MRAPAVWYFVSIIYFPIFLLQFVQFYINVVKSLNIEKNCTNWSRKALLCSALIPWAFTRVGQGPWFFSGQIFFDKKPQVYLYICICILLYIYNKYPWCSNDSEICSILFFKCGYKIEKLRLNLSQR